MFHQYLHFFRGSLWSHWLFFLAPGLHENRRKGVRIVLQKALEITGKEALTKGPLTVMRGFLESDRRQFARADVAWPVSMLAGKGSLDGTVKNISVGGALIHCEQRLDMNQPVQMGIEIPEYNHAILTTGQIVRSEIYDVDSTSPSYGFGVRFTEAPEEELEFFLRDKEVEWRSTVDTNNSDTKLEQDYPLKAEHSSLTKNNENESRSEQLNRTKLPFVLLSVGIMVLLILFTVFITRNLNEMEIDRIGSLQSRIEQLEASLTRLKGINDRLEQIDQRGKELTVFSDRFDRLEALITGKNARTLEGKIDTYYHEVLAGETLYGISRSYGLSVDELRRLNRLASKAVIYPGQKLIVSLENK